MKRLLKAYTSFTRTERMGLVGLCVLLAALITFRAAMHLWVKPEFDERQQQELLAAYSAWQNDNSLKSSPKRQQTETNGEFERSPEQAAVQTFDPNTADSVRLRTFGLRPVAISNLLKWRAKGKRFYRKEDLKPLYTLTEQEYRVLEPYIVIKNQLVDLNTADSATLVGLRGIGPRIAHKIIVRRSTVGGFTSYGQLLELYRFPDSVFSELKQHLSPLTP